MSMHHNSDTRKHKALNNVLDMEEWAIDEALVFCQGNVQAEGAICYMPWYMLMFCRPGGGAPLMVSW